MTRTPHDQFAKQCMTGFLEPFGKPLVSREVSSEVRQVDVWFEPNPSSAAEARQILGLLGRGTVQSQAVTELLALPATHPFKRHTLEQLANLRVSLQARQNLNKDERGLIMSLSPVYERWKEETLQKGEQEQRRKLLEAALASRFGAADTEMASLIPTMTQLSDAELAGLMLQMANLSREELLERFGR
jgi:hypothetical protein